MRSTLLAMLLIALLLQHARGQTKALPTIDERYESVPSPASTDLRSRGGATRTSAVYVEPYLGMHELELAPLIDQVLQRHPSVTAALAQYRAAANEIPQASAMPDPMFDYMMAPATIDSDVLDFAYVLQGRQPLPWPGKRPLRQQVAAHEARATYRSVADTRLELIRVTKQAYFDYYGAHAQQRLNTENIRALQQFREIAVTRYESDLVPQQDVLQAEVELAVLARRGLELQRAALVSQARINTLLLRAPDTELPPAPAWLPLRPDVPAAEVLRQVALSSRPDLAAIRSRIQAQRTAVALAQREFKPDLEFVGRFDKMWQNEDAEMQTQFGFSTNMPLYNEKRRAAVRQATARAAQQQAELANLSAQIEFEVQSAYERVMESQRVVSLFEERILPAARANVHSAEAGYTAGRIDFLRLVEAERGLIQLSEERVDAVADMHIRIADLERAVGSPLPAQSSRGERSF